VSERERKKDEEKERWEEIEYENGERRDKV
jgi:hypothetical protein